MLNLELKHVLAMRKLTKIRELAGSALSFLFVFLSYEANCAGVTVVHNPETLVPFTDLNPGSNPMIAGNGRKFGLTGLNSGWNQTSPVVLEEVEDGCEGDCVKLRVTTLPTYEASTWTKVLAATITVASFDGTQDEHGNLNTINRDYTDASQSEVSTHERGHAEIYSFQVFKTSTLWEAEAAGYETGCKETRAGAEAEWNTYNNKAQSGARLASGLVAAIEDANDMHSNIYAGQTRWIDPDPNWVVTKEVLQGLESMTFQFDSSQTQGYPEEDDENCVDDEENPNPSC